jgi:hypothetical protein
MVTATPVESLVIQDVSWMQTVLEGSTDPSASWGERTACTVCCVEPSPMAANATRFCFLTERT